MERWSISAQTSKSPEEISAAPGGIVDSHLKGVRLRCDTAAQGAEAQGSDRRKVCPLPGLDPNAIVLGCPLEEKGLLIL